MQCILDTRSFTQGIERFEIVFVINDEALPLLCKLKRLLARQN